MGYEWIPGIPGVNMPGDYDKDYAPDPWKWIMDEWERIKAGAYQCYVEDYHLEGLQAMPASADSSERE